MKLSNIKNLFFEKKLGKISLKRLAFVLLTGLALGYIPYAATAWISDITTKTNQYAAILLSADAITGYDHWSPPIAFAGSYPSWTLYFNSLGFKTDFIFSATAKDFYNVLMDNKYQSIVLVGHGSFNCWKATDKLVCTYDIERLAGKFRRKQGEWFQLTCPSPDYSSTHLGQLVMANDNYYFYSGNWAGTLDFVLDALFAFRNIKAEKNYEQIMR
jgi:hypothetical protein